MSAQGLEVTAVAADIVRIELLAFIVALVILVTYQLLTGRINTSGLLNPKLVSADPRSVSPARVQLLYATLAAAGYFLLQVLHDPSHWPSVPNWLLATQGGSGSIYLGVKSLNRLYPGGQTRT